VVEQVQAIGDGSVGLALTVGKYLTPQGHDLNGEGVAPDVSVTFEELIESDPELARLNAGIETMRQELATASGKMLQVYIDRQLAMAERAAGEQSKLDKEESTSTEGIENPAA